MRQYFNRRNRQYFAALYHGGDLRTMSSTDDLGAIRQLCKEIAGNSEITASCLYGSRAGGYARPDSDFDILLVLEDYPRGATFHSKRTDQIRAAILAADRELFELDMKKGNLGEFICTRMLGPYVALQNHSFLREMEVSAKKRIVQEELRDLVIEYEKISHGLAIDPTYLALSRLRKRARHYPSIHYAYVNMLRKDLRDANLRSVLAGYRAALRDLHDAGLIKFESNMIVLEDKFIDRILSRRSFEKVVNVVEMSRRALHSYLTYGLSRIGSVELILEELGATLRRSFQLETLDEKPEDPRDYLYLRTSTGMINLNERSSIVDIALRLRPGAKVAITPLAGVLNDVYLVSADDEQLVAKKYTDWFSLKWFTINLATLGTKKFSVIGKARLANEYAMNRILSAENIPVPEIVHVNIPRRILLERYVFGRNIADLVRAASSSDQLSAEDYKVAIEVGRTMARIHALDVAIGDSKPENLLVSSNMKIYSLDLEQASRKGDKAWDISEFLFYSGHYSPLMTSGLGQLIDGFIEGYIEFGERNVLRRASGLNYAKVFSMWTAPPIMLKVVERLRKA